MNQLKFGYTTGNDFTLTGTNYIGYYSVDDNLVPYTGKYITGNSRELTYKDNYNAGVIGSTYNFDQIIYDTSVLPYNNEVYIHTNEFITSNVLNSKFNYLQNNLIYTYSKLFIGSTDVPVNHAYVAGLSASDTYIKWYPNTNNQFFNSQSFTSLIPTYSAIDAMKAFVCFKVNEGYNVFGISDTHLIGLSSSTLEGSPTIAVVLYTNLVDENTDLECYTLSGISFNGQYVFVTDSSFNQVFRYNVEGYITNDASRRYKRNLIETIGGPGTTKSTDKFNGIEQICSSETNVLIIDQGNKCIKVYDFNFVYQQRISFDRNINLLIKSVKWCKFNNTYYVLIYDQTNENTVLYQYDSSFKLIDSWQFKDYLEPLFNEQFLTFEFSTLDSNVAYFLTNKNVYKKFLTNPVYSFARFQLSKFGIGSQDVNDNEFRDISIVERDDEYEDVFLLSTGKIFYCKEQTTYNDILHTNNIPYFSISDISLESQENVQSIIINKELYKLYANILAIKNRLLGQFYAEFDEYGNLRYKNYKYFDVELYNTINDTNNYDMYLNSNEPLNTSSINRVFKKIITMMQTIMSSVTHDISNFFPVLSGTNTVVID